MIELNPYERFWAAMVGVRRRLYLIANGTPNALGDGKDSWGHYIEGAAAEMCVAKHLDKYWLAVVPDKRTLKGDVGPYEVRCTPLPYGRLLLHDYDKDEAKYVLARGKLPKFEIIGWCYGREGKLPQYWEKGDGRDAFFVPNHLLHPMNELQGNQNESR